jgi:ferrochelatase
VQKAILFLNMGAPRNLDEVEVFLHNMFNDKNIITVKSNLLRAYIASSIIRNHKEDAKANYARIGGVSPLVKNTQKLLEKAQEAFEEYYVVNIMRYTHPFAFEEVKWLQLKGVTEIVVIPLYPHYSTTTTKSSLEDLYEALSKANFAPHMKVITRFYENRKYNQAIIEEIKNTIADECAKEYDLIFSAHSLPQKIIDNGDPYQKEVISHVNILQDMLHEQKLYFKNIHLAYQSKLGPQKWLEPSLQSKLEELRNKKVIIYPISFTLDNSETDYELDIEYREIAEELGFEEYRVAKCPNDSPLFIEAIRSMVECSK